MTNVVLDVSVAVKWALPVNELLKAEAFQLLERYYARQVQFIVPDIFWAELGNVFWKAVRQGRQSRRAAEEAIVLIVERDFPTISSRDLLSEAVAIALSCERTVYDSLYVALAVQTSTELITADESLANAMAARFPVKWLGAL